MFDGFFSFVEQEIDFFYIEILCPEEYDAS